jgi:hypothetical protein
MKLWVLIIIALLALASVIIWTFATAALYRRGRCRTYPYYWCDSGWECCKKGQDNCPASKPSGTSGSGSYKITDKFYGTNSSSNVGDDDHNQYYHLCIAPANAMIAANPGVDISCLYIENATCPIVFNNVAGYSNVTYNGSNNGLGGRCYYYSIDDSPDSSEQYNPSPTITYNYLPGYGSGNGIGDGYAQQPSLGGNTTNYYFAGNSGPGDTSGISWNNGTNQADTTNYSAWNRLAKNLTTGPPPS